MWRRFDGLFASGLAVLTLGWQAPSMQQGQNQHKQQAMPAIGASSITSETATVTAVDKKQRKLTLQNAQGQQVTLDAGEGIPNFDQIRQGDKVSVKYYQAVAIAIHKPGEAAPAEEVQMGTARVKAGRPMGMVGETVTANMLVDKVDTSNNKLTLRTPDGKTQTFAVENPRLQQSLSKLKPGDQVSVSYTEAAAVALMPQK